MLCCQSDCNYNLCEPQREQIVMKKWPCFHCILNRAIDKLYTLVFVVYFLNTVRLKAHVSFTTDLNLALQFRGDSGMVIGLNVKRVLPVHSIDYGLYARDVSCMHFMS